LEQKKGDLELICAKNMKIYTKIYCAKFLKILHQNMKPDAPLIVILLLRQAAYFSISDLESMVSWATLE